LQEGDFVASPAVRRLRFSWLAAFALIGPSSCITAPPLDNPVLVRNAADTENPILVSPGAPTGISYREVFEKCVDVLDDYFTIVVANPAEGRIVAMPRLVPGYEQFWKGGNPDPRGRLMATFQTLRQNAVIEIRVGERGGYLVTVVVEKEQEDIPRPSRQNMGAVFQEAPTVDRHLEVIGPAPTAPAGQSWFPIGRDFAFEQYLLKRIRECR
jgi:hypothetical protein